MPVWPLPLERISVVGGPTVTTPVALKVIGLPESDPDVAVTVFVPALAPKVRVLDARPELLVETLVALSDPPPAVTANVTATPETALPPESVTFTVNGLARG